MGSLAPSLGAVACPPAVYRRRRPRATSLYQLLETYYGRLKGLWEERFERRFGFWRGFYDTAVLRYLDCGLFESGFARAVCPKCRFEFLVAFSCKGRGLCPSCGANRAAIFSSLLHERILADVPHAQWVFALPKMLPCVGQRPSQVSFSNRAPETLELELELVQESFIVKRGRRFSWHRPSPDETEWAAIYTRIGWRATRGHFRRASTLLEGEKIRGVRRTGAEGQIKGAGLPLG